MDPTDKDDQGITGLVEEALLQTLRGPKTKGDLRVYHGILLAMMKIAEDSEQGIDPDQASILREIFEKQLGIKTDYAGNNSYVTLLPSFS